MAGRWWVSALIAGALGGAVGCRAAEPAGIDVVQVRFIAAPAGGAFSSAAWAARGSQLIVNFRPRSESNRDWQLVGLPLDGSDLRPLPLPDDGDCRFTSRHFPRALPDGRVGYLQQCWQSPTRSDDERWSLMAFDPGTGRAARLLPYFLPINAGAFTFAPDLQRGLVNDGVGLAERLHWLLPNRIEPLPLPLARVGSPTWSPDGRSVAVFGVPDAGGARGADRLLLPRTLYLLDPATAALRKLVDGFNGGGPPEWSPDGRWLLMTVEMRDGRKELWLIEVATAKRYRLRVGGDLGSPAWLPDGRTVVVPVGALSQYVPSTPGPVGLQILELPDLDRLASPSS